MSLATWVKEHKAKAKRHQGILIIIKKTLTLDSRLRQNQRYIIRLCLKYIYVSSHGLKYTFNARFQNVLCEMFFLIVTVSLHYICSRDDRSCNCNINGTNMENSAVSLGTLVIMLTLIMFSTNEQKLHASNRVRFYCIAVSMLYRQATDR